VNSELVGKIVNLMSRVAPMLSRLLESQTGVITQDALGLLDAFRREQDEMIQAYEGRHFAAVTRMACQLADRANKFVEDNAPWALVKRDPEAARGVLTAALECSRILAIYLKPIVPTISAKIETCLRTGELKWSDIESSMAPTRILPFEHLVNRLDERNIRAMLQENQSAAQAPAASPAAPATGNPSTPAASGPAPVGVEPLAPTCTIDQFAAVDLRVGKIVAAQAVEESDKLMRLEVDAGPLGRRHILAGIKKAYTADQLTGRMIIFCANLAPRKMKFGVSEGMILAAGSGGAEVFVLGVDSGAKPGERVH
jgi:methionyl-tRNA synthetase